MTKDDEKIVSDLEKQIDDLTKQLAAMQTADAGLKKATEDNANLQKAIEALTAEKNEAEVMAKLTDSEKEYIAELSPADKAKFMAKSPADRKAEVAADAKDAEDVKKRDEIIKVGETEIRKSVVGDAQFAVIKSQQDEIQKNREDLAKERDAREIAVLEKRADDEFKHVPGTVQERAQMLRTIGKLDEPLQKAFVAVLTQSEAMAKAGFDKIGNTGNANDLEKGKKNGIHPFEKKVEEIQNAHKGMSKTDAMTKARQDFPKEFSEYQGQPVAN